MNGDNGPGGALTLVIGNRNYSSWSLRPWLVLRHFGIAFDEVLIPLFEGDWQDRLREYSPSLKVPVLVAGTEPIWESLAIIEFLAETNPGAPIWPDDPRARARARAISAEMHAGFQAMRNAMPMNIRARFPGPAPGPGVDGDIQRVFEIWRDCRDRYGQGGEFLFGAFSAADAMFAPVVWRLTGHEVELDEVTGTYAAAVRDLPAMREWAAAARAETWRVEAYEPKSGSRG